MQSQNASVELAAAAERATDFLRALSHPARLRMVCALLDGEMNAGDLANRAGLKAPALSQQAAVLEAEGLIQRSRDAQSILYSLSSAAVRAQAKLLHRLFCPRLPRVSRTRHRNS